MRSTPMEAKRYAGTAEYDQAVFSTPVEMPRQSTQPWHCGLCDPHPGGGDPVPGTVDILIEDCTPHLWRLGNCRGPKTIVGGSSPRLSIWPPVVLFLAEVELALSTRVEVTCRTQN